MILTVKKMERNVEITKRVLLNSKREIVFKFLASILLRGSLMIIPILYSYAVDGLSEKDYKLAYIMIGISLVVAVIYRLGEYYNQVTYFNLYNKLYKQYTNIALSKTYRNSIYSLSRINLGEYTNILNNDIDIISGFWSASVIRIVQLFEFIFIYVYFFIIDVYIGIITIVISVLAFLILNFYRKKIGYLSHTRKEMLDKKTGILQELFLGIKEIKGLNIFSAINKRIEKANHSYLNSNADYNVKSNKNKFISLFTIEFFRLILFLYGIYLISHNQMEIGVLLIIYNYYSKLIEDFTEIGNVNVDLGNLKTSMNRFYKLIEYSKKNVSVNKEDNIDHIGKIVFANVLYGNRERPTLKDASFTIEPESITVITGKPIGSESGIFDLLLRLNVQHEGKVLIDDIDIREYSDNEYYDLVSSARRDPSFFKI
jgi:ABC-type multidrug transport system fused ATPase/permease subunit